MKRRERRHIALKMAKKEAKRMGVPRRQMHKLWKMYTEQLKEQEDGNTD